MQNRLFQIFPYGRGWNVTRSIKGHSTKHSIEAEMCEANVDDDLVNILDKFDPSVKGKFERCARTDWCVAEADNKVSKSGKRSKSKIFLRSKLARKSKFLKKVSKKLECMKVKTCKISKSSKVRMESCSHQAEASAVHIESKIRNGSNTPASSRPSSINMTMEQIESIRKSVEPQFNQETSCCSISISVGGD